MFQLKTGYLFTGIVTGLILLGSIFTSLPDGKLHIVFCDVGQGDGAYVRFPDGRDMVVDGGPNDKILGCLGKYMPFWDREIDIVVLTHPQKDHMQGLLSILERYDVGYFVHSDIVNATEGFAKLRDILNTKKIAERLVTRGERIAIGEATLSVIWPSADQIAMMNPELSNVLSASSVDLNDGSVVFWLRHGSFDTLFTGDADNRVNGSFIGSPLADDSIELLKVPHHGSKTGMTEQFLAWLKPKMAIISVGKNSYGHPTREVLELLARYNSVIHRTDESGDIEVVSDGKTWEVVR